MQHDIESQQEEAERHQEELHYQQMFQKYLEKLNHFNDQVSEALDRNQLALEQSPHYRPQMTQNINKRKISRTKWDGKHRSHNKTSVKDPNAPKRPLSTFIWYCNDERPKVKEENPQFSFADIAKEIGRRWTDVKPEVKDKYQAMADKDKVRYEQEMSDYKKRMHQVPTPFPYCGSSSFSYYSSS